jgi:hypothetical protein
MSQPPLNQPKAHAITLLICGATALFSEPAIAENASLRAAVGEMESNEQTLPNSDSPPRNENTPSEPTHNNQQQARLHFNQGLSLLRSNNYQLALEEFLAAQNLAPHHVVLFNVARVYEELFQLDKAIEYYSAYLDESAHEASPLKRSQAERALDRLRSAIERREKSAATSTNGQARVPLKISCPYPDFQVLINGHIQGNSPLGGTILVPQDATTITFTRPGYQGDTHSITPSGTPAEVSCTPSRKGTLPKDESGFLHLSLLPASATVRINGEYTNASDPVLLPRGRHLIEVQAPHHMAQAVTIDLDSRFIEHQIALVPEESSALATDRRQAQKVVGVTLGSVGALMAGTTVGLYAWNHARHRTWQRERDALSQEPSSAPDLAERRGQNNARLQSIQTVDTVTWATGIAAGAFVGAGLFTYFFKWNGGHGEVAVSARHISFASRW